MMESPASSGAFFFGAHARQVPACLEKSAFRRKACKHSAVQARWGISLNISLGHRLPFHAAMTYRAAIAMVAAALLACSFTAALAAEPTPAELISSFRLKHGEVKVERDTTLDRIAREQARAMAEKDNLSHEVLGQFSSRISPSQAGRAAENIAYGYDSFDKTLDQWIASSEHRKNLLLHNASRIGIASAKDASGKRTYWAMEIAGDYEPKPNKRKDRMIAGGPTQGPLVKRVVEVSAKNGSTKNSSTKIDTKSASAKSDSSCHIKLLSLCL
jgi:Cysteine-rich secretory protein family